MMQEIDSRLVAIDFNGKKRQEIVSDCKEVICFLKEKLNELKTFMQTHSFEGEAEEITFFKQQKPALVGRLMYYHKIYRIESKCPLDSEQIDNYYMKRQEELKLFFDRHIAFYQYYRSGATYHDSLYFVRGKQEISFETETYDLDCEPEFSTCYDRLVARVISMEMLYAYLTARRRALVQSDAEPVSPLLPEHRWTGKIIELVELVYALDTSKCIDNGRVKIEELADYLSLVFGVEIKHCFVTYADMKKRKSDSRTYFLNELKDKLNQRMNDDDEK